MIDSAFDGCIDELSITDGFLATAELQPRQSVAIINEFKVLMVQPETTGSDWELTFESDDTRPYTVQWSPSLQTGTGVDVVSLIPDAAGASQTTVTELPAPSPRSFYRVTIEL